MLLVVLCEKMTASYEQVFLVLTEQYNEFQGPVIYAASASSAQHSGNTTPDCKVDHQMEVKDYHVDMDEQPCVFGSLASMQMRKLKTFLVKVKAILRRWNCDLHIATVDLVEARLLEQLQLFEKDSIER